MGVVAYDLYVSVGTGPNRQLTQVRENVTSPFTVSPLEHKTTYEFVLKARDAAETSRTAPR